MKRRNFFSKIAKGLLGIGIIKSLPTPEVETAPSAPQTSQRRMAYWIGLCQSKRQWSLPWSKTSFTSLKKAHGLPMILMATDSVIYQKVGKRVCRRIRVNPKPSE